MEIFERGKTMNNIQQDFQMRLNYVEKTYFEPELSSRKAAVKLPEEFKVFECLIRLPENSNPIIEFNDEIGWEAEPLLVSGNNLVVGQPYFAHDVVGLKKILPPKVEDKYVAYIYFFWNGYNFVLLEDNTPTQINLNPGIASFDGHNLILQHINNKIMEKVVGNAKFVRDSLHDIGMWIVPSLLHYPLAKIVERIGNKDFEGARGILTHHCTTEFISQKLVRTWHPITAFRERYAFFDDALFCHENERYHASISTLVGQIEGIITDWLYETNCYTVDTERSLKQKIDDYRQELNKIPDLLWMYRESCNSMLAFLGSDPWLQKFPEWMVIGDTSFPGRHVVQHGKYDIQTYNEENSIKLFLMLDTICQFMMFYEVRVMKRDIGQNEGNINT
jgi:hypothetical protein